MFFFLHFEYTIWKLLTYQVLNLLRINKNLTFSLKIYTKTYYVIPDDTTCPVMLFKLYLSKLHSEISSLWQKPREGHINYIDEFWFERRNVGKDMLKRFMKISLSKAVKLDGNYTNHSIRAMVISTLDEAGFEGRHIIQLSSHKSESTIKEYCKKCPWQQVKRDVWQSY